MRLILAILLLVAMPAAGQSYSCTVVSSQGAKVMLDCIQAAVVTPEPKPPAPPPPAPPAPAAPACPPNMSPMICSMLGYGQPTAGPNTGPAPGADGGGYERPAFDFRNGDILFFRGISDTKTLQVPAGWKGTIILHTGDGAGNQADFMQLVVRNSGTGQTYIDDRMRVAYQTPQVRVNGGERLLINASAAAPLTMSMRLELVQ